MHRASFRFALLLIAIAIAIAACNHRVDAPQLGVYRAVLRLPGGDTPFGFEVAQEQQHYVLYLKNGTDRQRRRRRHLGGDVHERQGARLRKRSCCWSNCHDEARMLVPFYREYRERGFEIAALMFERHGEFAKAARAVRGYRKDLGIEFPTLIAGLSATDEASKALPMLSGVYGYPTAILVDRSGRVHSIHTGFAGPATGRHYEEHVREFRDEVEQLLAGDTVQ
jgi:hypothetical protein